MSKPRTKKPKAPPKSRWEKSADRENARRLAKAPLLVSMGVLPLVTAEERQTKHERRMAALEAQREEDQARLEAEVTAVRVELEAKLTAEELAHVDATRPSYPEGPSWDLTHWRKAIDAKTATHEPPLPKATDGQIASDPRRSRRADPTPQLSLFEPNNVPVDEPVHLDRAPPCDDCGWKPGETPFAFNIHRQDCPGLRAFFAGLWDRCDACKVTRQKGGRACEDHLARTRACAKEGCIPGPSKRPNESEVACQRCGAGMATPQAA